jgi:poly [ADP-ribose] polymerase
MSTTVDTVMLVKVSSNENNNKFYEVKLASDGSVSKRWGRVGATGQTSVEHTDREGFEKIVRSKKGRGYKEVKLVNTACASTDKSDLRRVTQRSLAADPKDTQIVKLIDRLVEKNRHEIIIASGGLIEISKQGVIETALGIIQPQSLETASDLLDELAEASPNNKGYKDKLEEYLTLVPQKLPSKRGWELDFFNENSIASQKQFLHQLEQSYEWYENERKALDSSAEVDFSDLFRYNLASFKPADKSEFKRIEELFAKTRNPKHPTFRMRLHQVYRLRDRQGEEAFAARKKALGNTQKLWHGTQVVNILSILRRGLYVPPVRGGSIQTTGRMFGDGVYFSSQSTKSLNYSSGFWQGSRNSSDVFMFLADVVCGREYHPSAARDHTKAYDRHNCIHVKPHTAGVLNDEVIVWETEQIRLKYLCEFR